MKVRFLPRSPNKLEELHDWMRRQKIGPSDLVFPNRYGRPLNRQNLLSRMLRPAAQRAGIRTLDVDWQMLRRTFSTIAQLVDMHIKSVQAQLGHSQPNLTLIEYQQPIDELMGEKLARLEQMIEGKLPMPVDAAAKLGSRLIQ